MEDPEVQILKVKEVVALADKHKLIELTVNEGDLAITVRRTSNHPALTPPSVAETTHFKEIEVIVEEECAEEDLMTEHNLYELTSPLVGVFYRAPSPDAPNFVEVGDIVEAGQEVGLIEAMKVFSPVPCEIAGTILEIPVKNGQLVHEGDTLIRIEPTV